MNLNIFITKCAVLFGKGVNGFAKQKIQGGKLVYVRIRYDSTIESVEILGDFFMHPEEALLRIENALVGAEVKNRGDMLERVEKVVLSEKIEMVGISPSAIVDTIMIAVAQ